MKGKKKGKLHGSRTLRKHEKMNRASTTGYITRGQITKRLHLTLNDFRRLCVYKGIHPVEPGLKRIRSKHGNKTWYYMKDVNYMNRDEVVNWFRNVKAYKKKKAYLKGVDRPAELAALKTYKPKLNMDHFVKERYPTLQDAVNDMDDALTLMFLFVEMQYGVTNTIMNKKQFAECSRLKSEWQSYVVESHCLRKVFVSIKGIYYQAEVLGSTVTWSVPHPQRVRVPWSVDVVTMCFFVDFYISMLSFVFYKLFTDLGLHYPPKIDAKLLSNDEGVKSVIVEKIVPQTLKTETAPMVRPTPAPLTQAEKERIAIVNQKLAHIISVDEAQSEAKSEDVLPATEVKTEPTDEEIPDEFRKVDEEAGENKEQYHRPASLFAGLKFLVNREIPKPEIRFMIRAFGGEDFTEYDLEANNIKITHQVVDRDWPKNKMLLTREYIQPQWIFDSINAGILLPYHEYAPDATLPPHISPFINDAMKGYVPKQREHLNELIENEKGVKPLKADEEEEKDSDEEYIGDDSDDEDVSAMEAAYMKELSAEQEGRSYSGYVEDELGLTPMMGQDKKPDASSKEKDEESDEEVDKALKKKKKTKKELLAEKLKAEDEEREEMSLDLLNAKTKRIIKAIKGRVERNNAVNENLEQKRKDIEKKKKKAARDAPPAGEKRKAEEPGNKKAKKVKK